MFLLAPAVATTMTLLCPGVWTFGTSDSAFVKGHWVWVDSTAASEGEVRVEIEGNAGRLLDMSGKKSKSRPLSDVRVEGSQVQAKLPSFLWSHPRVTIDLSAERIRINDTGGYFLGVCRTAGSGDPS
ncbi:MAG TPA: hypothetical protein VFW19_06365 [Allosphingosinicella sp.]|nr:hypothetical protein [Allosphingosinicella sp.]